MRSMDKMYSTGQESEGTKGANEEHASVETPASLLQKGWPEQYALLEKEGVFDTENGPKTWHKIPEFSVEAYSTKCEKVRGLIENFGKDNPKAIGPLIAVKMQIFSDIISGYDEIGELIEAGKATNDEFGEMIKAMVEESQKFRSLVLIPAESLQLPMDVFPDLPRESKICMGNAKHSEKMVGCGAGCKGCSVVKFDSGDSITITRRHLQQWAGKEREVYELTIKGGDTANITKNDLESNLNQGYYLLEKQ